DMRNNANNSTQWQRTMSGFDSTVNVQVISIGDFNPNITPNGTSSVQPGYFTDGIWFKYNGDPSIDGEPFTVLNTADNYNLYSNDPIYVLSNADIIPPIFNVEPAVITTDYCQYVLTSDHDITMGVWSQGNTEVGKVADNSGSLTLELVEINGNASSLTSVD